MERLVNYGVNQKKKRTLINDQKYEYNFKKIKNGTEFSQWGNGTQQESSLNKVLQKTSSQNRRYVEKREFDTCVLFQYGLIQKQTSKFITLIFFLRP